MSRRGASASRSPEGFGVASVLLLALLLAGCPRRATDERTQLGPLSISQVTIKRQPEDLLQTIGVSEAAVAGWVSRWIKDSAEVTRAAPAAKAKAELYRLALRLGLGEQRQPGGGLEPAVLVEARLEQPGELDAPALQAGALSPLPRALVEQQDPAGQAAVKKVVQQVLDDLRYQAELATGSEQRLVQALSQRDDLQRLAAAVEIAAVRRPPGAFAALVALLKHPKSEIADRAVGALVALGDRRAVPQLTRLSKFSDTARLAKLIDAIGTLGGEEARAYLELVASGHEDPDIRDMAQEALERLKLAEQARPQR